MIKNVEQKTNIININNISYNTIKTFTILQLAEHYFIEIPKFCYHEKLSIAGNCRMCLVEVEGVKKPIASCALPISANMSILTKSQLVKKAREGILEFLLINHPLDCPICDQGGECDLQEQSFNFGTDKGRFYEVKRAVMDKECGPFIKTIMTRCIHCTRCVRYLTEIAGVNNFGVVGRGASMEISNYLDKSIVSELSGNVIDLCPVGALTSKPYSFTARSWELENIETIDLLDPFLPNIRVDLRDRKVMRILPRYNSIIAESWITDVSRFSYDSFFINRLSFPYFAEKSFFLKKTTWLNIFNTLKFELETCNVFFILGNFLDAETLFLLKQIIKKKGNALALSTNEKINNVDFRNSYIWEYNNTFFKSFNTLITLGVNLRYEAPFINIKLKQIKNQNIGFNLICWGSNVNLTYNYHSLGSKVKNLVNFFLGKNKLSNKLFGSKLQILISQNLSNQFSISTIHFMLHNLNSVLNKNKKNSFINAIATLSSLNNVLPYELNLFNTLSKLEDFSYNCNNSYNKKTKIINYFLNTSKLKVLNDEKTKSINLYQGHHSFPLLANFDYILPTTFFLEKNALYLNILGSLKISQFVLTPPKQARNDLQILVIFFITFISLCNKDFTLQDITSYVRKSLIKLSPLFNSNNKLKIKKQIITKHTMSFTNTSIFLEKNNLINNQIKQPKLVNFLLQNQLTNLSVNLNLANQEQANYFSSFK